MKLKRIALVLLISFPLISQGQGIQSPLAFEGYLETYYLYDFGRPENHERPDFLYNFKRHNEFSVNFASLGVNYQEDAYRGALRLMVGNYSQYNLADEPAWAQFVYEASVGVSLGDRLWLDMGVMPSHIGFESAVGSDCWHLSRSLLAENSPYFLTGMRLSYELLDGLNSTFWVTNGWQNVQRRDRHESLGFGLGLNYRKEGRWELNYANYFGNEYPQPLQLYRFFQNTYLQYLGGPVDITFGVDHGIEQRLFTATFNQWFGVTGSLRKSLSESLKAAARLEYYADPAGVILSDGMRISGASLNVDYQISPNAVFRVEGRRFISPEPIFNRPLGLVNRGNSALATSLAIRFD
ncbi:outer membrane beta-barrel protein [Lunatimonas lonarensis]|nr:outer membrane beta-barrel protein [Lunatimonas lonarensis]